MSGMLPGRPTDALVCGMFAALLAELGLLKAGVRSLPLAPHLSVNAAVLWCSGALIGLAGVWAWFRLSQQSLERRSRWLGATGMLLSCAAAIWNGWMVVSQH